MELLKKNEITCLDDAKLHRPGNVNFNKLAIVHGIVQPNKEVEIENIQKQIQDEINGIGESIDNFTATVDINTDKLVNNLQGKEAEERKIWQIMLKRTEKFTKLNSYILECHNKANLAAGRKLKRYEICFVMKMDEYLWMLDNTDIYDIIQDGLMKFHYSKNEEGKEYNSGIVYRGYDIINYAFYIQNQEEIDNVCVKFPLALNHATYDVDSSKLSIEKKEKKETGLTTNIFSI